MANAGIRRIKGVTTRTVLDGREVEVVFRSPYRWRIYEHGEDVTKEFGHALRGEALPADTAEWRAFHAAVSAGEIWTRLQCAA